MTTLVLEAPLLEPCSPPGRWADLPVELLRAIVTMALQPVQHEAPAATAAAATTLPRLPSMRETARLLSSASRCCRSWRHALADLPLRASLGPPPLPPTAAATLPLWLAATGRQLKALHFAAPPRRGCRPGAVQHLAVQLLASEAFAAVAGGLHGGGGQGKALHIRRAMIARIRW